MMSLINGKKTYGVGIALLAYLAVQIVTKQEVDQNIVTGLLAAMGLTIRHGINEN